MLAREKIWFPGIDSMINDEVKSCLSCAIATNNPTREPLIMSELPTAPWTEVSIDFTELRSYNVSLVVIYDDYSRYPVVKVLSSICANTVITVLDEVFVEFCPCCSEVRQWSTIQQHGV